MSMTVIEYSSATLYGIRKYDTAGSPKATGGIISFDSANNKWVHAFTASGTFTPTEDITCEYLVVAGGGGGSQTRAGGGGAGGYRSSVSGESSGGGGSAESALSLTALTGYTVTVGAGGAGGTGGYASLGSRELHRFLAQFLLLVVAEAEQIVQHSRQAVLVVLVVVEQAQVAIQQAVLELLMKDLLVEQAQILVISALAVAVVLAQLEPQVVLGERVVLVSHPQSLVVL
jgi:hypothetical protein